MYNRAFLATPLGKAALASVAAMTAMLAFSTQVAPDAGADAFETAASATAELT